MLIQKDTPISKTLVSRKQLAERWGCSVLTIKRREKEGLLKPVNLSQRLVRYRITDIEAIEAGQLDTQNPLPRV